MTYEVALYELAHLLEIFLSKVVVVVKGNAVEGKFVSLQVKHKKESPSNVVHLSVNVLYRCTKGKSERGERKNKKKKKIVSEKLKPLFSCVLFLLSRPIIHGHADVLFF